MGVPFVDLKAQYESIRGEVNASIQEVIEASSFVLGPAVERFEKEFAKYLGVEEVVGINNGTAALQLTLLALDIGEGDEVIVPAHTFIATAEAVSHVGAVPVFVDVRGDTGNLNASLLPAAITGRTRAIVPVHLYGQPADLEPILHVAAEHRIPVIEDACQAHGARYHQRRAGSYGRASCFSFYPGKNLGAYGEGGAVATDDPELAARVRRLRDHGQTERYRHAEIGYNARLEGIQGAVLGVKLKHLDAWNRARRERAGDYAARLGRTDVVLPVEAPGCESVYHLYVIRSKRRDALRAHLTELGVQTGLHYPVPLPLQPAYAELGHREGDFPEAEAWARECLSLPMFAELLPAQLEEVIQGMKSFAYSAAPQAN
ncbi:MAG TPA: DegT/DnrJ/EryC1/StrS family aminotransferase, partial [Candidatus Eisenbacteria bacterium]|nr:DegT/DnrJ/EryC1/StrS family aminotransferase [Candidatus Eisenbacteria bacterium]